MVEKKVQKKSKKVKKNVLNLTLFIIGLTIAIIGSIANTIYINTSGPNKAFISILIILGIVLGLINIKSNETLSFLVASLTFILMGGPFLGLISQTFIQSKALVSFFSFLLAFIVPSAMIVALRTIYLTAKDD